MPKKAIIIPGSTDANLGDQALVWETISIINDVNEYDEILIVDGGSNHEERTQQTRETAKLGHRFLRRIVLHPRRGRHNDKDKVNERALSLILMILYGALDFLLGTCVLKLARYPIIVRFLISREKFNTFLEFKNAETVFVKGGGFLHSYGGIAAPYQIWYMTFYLRLAHELGVRVVILPNSFGPFHGLTVRRQIQHVLSKCSFIAAREGISAKTLSMEVALNVPTFPDLGYYLTVPDNQQIGQHKCRLYNVPLGEKKCVAFTLRPYRFPTSNQPAQAYKAYIESVAGLIRYIAEKNYYPVLVTQVYGPSSHENDRLAINDLRQIIANIEHSWIDEVENCIELKAIYGEMDFLVGTRFHSVIFAQEQAIPCIAIAYGGNKGTGIMSDIGLDEYVIPIEDVNSSNLIRLFDQLVANEVSIKERLHSLRTEMRVNRSELIHSIKEHLSLEE